MREHFLILSQELTCFFMYGVFITLVMSSVYVDVNWMHNALHENSLTEIFQEVLLGLTTTIFFLAAARWSSLRGGLILIGGFYACMLIRELDFLFDYIRHGCWVWFALFTAMVSTILALRTSESIGRGLVNFVQHPTWQMSATGLLIILVFSRFFGMHQLWQNLMLDGYNRVVKNMVEEGMELLGYSICFLASVKYIKNKSHADDNECGQ